MESTIPCLWGRRIALSTRDIHESSAVHTIHCFLGHVISKRNAAANVDHTSQEHAGDFVTSGSEMVIRGKGFESDRLDGLRKCWTARTQRMISVAVGQMNPRVHSTNDGWLGLSSAWTCRLGVLLVLPGVFSWRTGSWAELCLDNCFDPIKKDDPQDRHAPVPSPGKCPIPSPANSCDVSKRGLAARMRR